MVGAPLQIQPSNNGSMQPTGAIYSCNLTEDECTVLNQPSFYTFNGTLNFCCVYVYYGNICTETSF